MIVPLCRRAPWIMACILAAGCPWPGVFWLFRYPAQGSLRDYSRVLLEDKIRKNELSGSSSQVAGFRSHYYALRQKGVLSGEDLFNGMRSFARRGSMI